MTTSHTWAAASGRRDPARAVVAAEFAGSSNSEDPSTRRAAAQLHGALARFTTLLPPSERPHQVVDLLAHVASSNTFDELRQRRRLPITILFFGSVHASYYRGESRIGDSPWRICYTDGGAVRASSVRDGLLDEVIRLAEAMHEKNPFGEVPFDGGKTLFVQEGPRFQAVTAIYGDPGMPRFVLAKGGIRYRSVGWIPDEARREALGRWAASSALAGILSHKYIGGPDMRMGAAEMAWIQASVDRIGAARPGRRHPAVTGLDAPSGGFPHEAWELTGRTVVASLKEALRHPGLSHYHFAPAQAQRPVRILLQGFGDVGGSVARLLTEESPDFDFRVTGVADEHGALVRTEGLDVRALLELRASRRSIAEHQGPVDALWLARPSDADRARPEFRGTAIEELVLEEADIFIPAAIPNVITEAVASRLRVRLVAEGANNAVAPRVEVLLHGRGILYLPGQALNWGGVRGSTLEALFRELTKRRVSRALVEDRIRAALAPFGPGLDAGWALELLRSGLSGPPLDLEETRAFAIAILEDLARSNMRWLMNELVASRHAVPPIELVRGLSRAVRARKGQLLSLVDDGLGAEFFAEGTSVHRLRSLLDDKLKELLADADGGNLTARQVVEQRQMLQQVQKDVPNGLSPVFAALLAALDLARQKVMDPDGYSQEALRHDLRILRQEDATTLALENSLYRLQRVHPGLNRSAFEAAAAALVRRPTLAPVVRRNAALAIAKLGSANPAHRRALVEGLADADLSVRAACRWALHHMAIECEPPLAASGS